MHSYCLIPQNCQQFWNFVDHVPLAAEHKLILKNSTITKVQVNVEKASWEICLRLPRKLPKPVLDTVAKQLCINCGLKQVTFTPKASDIHSYLEDEWPNFIAQVVTNKATRLLLKNVEWSFSQHVLTIKTLSDFSVQMLQTQGIVKNIQSFMLREFNEICEVNITTADTKAEICPEEDLLTPEYREALTNIPDPSHEKKKSSTHSKIVFGHNIKSQSVAMNTIQDEARNVVIEGQLIGFESRELRSGRFLLTFDLIDDTDGLSGKVFFDNKEQFNRTLACLSTGMSVKAKGTVQYDKFAKELVMFADSMCEVPSTLERSDNSDVRRVELHAHTKMSNLDSVASVKGLIETAAKWGHPAIAITDHGVVQAFPEAHDVAAKAGIKVIYGMEGYLFENDINQSRHVVILAKNPCGLRNLYRIVSLSHLKYLHRKPRIPKKILVEYREGLIFGSACEAGELIQAIVNQASDEELLEIAAFYDYLEIQPIGNNEFLVREGKVSGDEALQDINRKVLELGKKLNKPVVATCDVHFLNPKDEVYRRILMAGQGYSDADHQPPLYLRTTEEMLAEFSYLGKEKAYEVVVTNSRLIAESIEEFKPIPDELYSPQIPGAEEQISSMSYQQAQKLYGTPLPKIVEDRLKIELDSIINHGFAVLYFIAHKLVKKSLDDGYLVGSRGSVGSSFVAHMTGITEVNALPPHWRCPHCQYSEFITDGSYGSGFDLPDKSCPHCGTNMSKDGHNIPFAVFMGFHGDKVPDIDLNFSGDYQPVAHKYTEELFGRDNVFRAGTIATIADKTAYGFVKNYFADKDIIPRNASINYLVAGCTGVKRTTGQHPAGIMVVPRDMDVHYFTPIQYPADDKNSGTITTHFDYHSISSRLVKLDILGHDDPTVLRMLQDITGIDPRTIPFDDKETMSIFSSTTAIGLTPEELGNKVGTLGIPEFGTRFVRQMLENTMPKKFSELVRISGFSHGTDVWLNNAQDLIAQGVAKLSEAISARDDIMLYLIQKGVEPVSAFKIMEKVRKGKGLNEEDIEKMKAKDVPDWYIGSCQKIKYMFPKAHAVAYVMMAFRIAYFKVHDPKAFYAAYFSVRATDFDADLIVQGAQALKNKLKEFEEKGNAITAKEKSIMTIVEIALEMYLRGLTFHRVDLYHSDATKFKIVEDGLLPPFAALQGLGDNAARNIQQARDEKPFSSIEDLRLRAHISKAVIEILKTHGCLKDLPETDQMVLFA